MRPGGDEVGLLPNGNLTEDIAWPAGNHGRLGVAETTQQLASGLPGRLRLGPPVVQDLACLHPRVDRDPFLRDCDSYKPAPRRQQPVSLTERLEACLRAIDPEDDPLQRHHAMLFRWLRRRRWRRGPRRDQWLGG